METPKYYEFMNPVLQALRERGDTLTNEEIVDAVVHLMHLPDAVVDRKPSGQNLSEVEYRIAWAKSYLKKAGYLTQSARGVWALTAQGKATDVVNVRTILTDIRKDYVVRRKQRAQLHAPPDTHLALRLEDGLPPKASGDVSGCGSRGRRSYPCATRGTSVSPNALACVASS